MLPIMDSARSPHLEPLELSCRRHRRTGAGGATHLRPVSAPSAVHARTAHGRRCGDLGARWRRLGQPSINHRVQLFRIDGMDRPPAHRIVWSDRTLVKPALKATREPREASADARLNWATWGIRTGAKWTRPPQEPSVNGVHQRERMIPSYFSDSLRFPAHETSLYYP